MNPVPFIAAAYLIALGALLSLVLTSHTAMRTAERDAERLREGRR